MNSPDKAGLNAALAATLNGERVRAGLTFAELAKRSGISERTLMRLLSTVERDIDIRVLENLAGIFHTTGSALLADAEAWMARQDGGDQPAEDVQAKAAAIVTQARADAGTSEDEGTIRPAKPNAGSA